MFSIASLIWSPAVPTWAVGQATDEAQRVCEGTGGRWHLTQVHRYPSGTEVGGATDGSCYNSSIAGVGEGMVTVRFAHGVALSYTLWSSSPSDVESILAEVNETYGPSQGERFTTVGGCIPERAKLQVWTVGYVYPTRIEATLSQRAENGQYGAVSVKFSNAD